MTKLDTGHGPFVQLINQGQVYAVPEYQRSYSWKPKRQVAELWGDIHRLYLHRINDQEIYTHFIGSVVTGAAAAKALGPAEYPVIDGQQRLVTLSLIVAAIRDEIVTSKIGRENITNKYLALTDEDGQLKSRIKPGNADRKTFDQIIAGEQASNTTNNVYKSYHYIRLELSKGPGLDVDPDSEEDESTELSHVVEIEDEAADDLPISGYLDEGDLPHSGSIAAWDWKALIEVVGTQLELVSIADVPAESAYQIFATLNSKGMELRQVDLIRNGIFMLMPKQGKRAHSDIWLPLENTLGQKRLQDYLHTWVIRQGQNVPVKETYSSTMRLLSKPGSSERQIHSALQRIYTGAWAYSLITEPTSKDREVFFEGRPVQRHTIDALTRLQQWGARPAEPVLVETLERYRAERISAEEVTRILSYLESFVVRRHISFIPPNDLRSTFARLTQQISVTTTSAAFERALIDGLKEPARRWPTDAELLNDMIHRPLYRKKSVRQASFILQRIAEHLQGKESPRIQFGTGSADYSVEHILPRTLSTEWRTALAEWGADPFSTHASRLDIIGNLTITAYNSELSNKSFIEKKKMISANSGLELSKGILSAQKWTQEEIDSRSEMLWRAAQAIWPRP